MPGLHLSTYGTEQRSLRCQRESHKPYWQWSDEDEIKRLVAEIGIPLALLSESEDAAEPVPALLWTAVRTVGDVSKPDWSN